jgi:peptide/nickel transport system substrate-binding protein
LAWSGAGAAETTLRLGLDALPLSLGNPYRTAAIPSIYTLSAMFDGLTRLDDRGQLLPWLAVKWESADNLVWRFTLRDGVKFSNGAPLDAQAVKTAVDYLASEAAVKEGLVREIPAMRGARAIDARTVEITLAEPDPLFPRSASALPIAEPGQWTRLGREDFGRAPVGTGPFMLERWESNRGLFRAFAGSWRRPKVDRLEILAVPDRSARVQAVLSGQLDVAIGLGPEDVRTIAAGGGRDVRVPTAQVFAWTFMLTRKGVKTEGPLADARVRRALTMATNRQAIIDTLLDGAGVVADQPAARIAFGHNPAIAPLPYDPTRAKALLSEAGYPQGFAMALTMSAGSAAADSEIHQRIADDLAKIGVRVEIRSVPMAQYLQHISRASFETDAFGMTFPNDPNLDALRPLRIHSCLRREPFYCDQRIMPKIEAALREGDPKRSLALRHEIMAWYAAEAPSLFIYEGVRFVGTTAKVSGYDESNGNIAFDRITLER